MIPTLTAASQPPGRKIGETNSKGRLIAASRQKIHPLPSKYAARKIVKLPGEFLDRFLGQIIGANYRAEARQRAGWRGIPGLNSCHPRHGDRRSLV